MGKKFYDNKDSSDGLPNYTRVYCEECGWIGEIKNCTIEYESEGWEYPEYEVLVCPKCETASIELC